ncbi:unnamed protein product, partial [Mesorhabditis belari]|uniref:Chloride channel protein n=1 Tax=Mesorhabditis belari TaxID=2138241 RepID=A0AAF3F4G3_9BILA
MEKLGQYSVETETETETPLVNGSTSSTDSEEEDETLEEEIPHETTRQFFTRQYRNIVHFFVEDWFLSGLLGVITAVLSITTDVGIEYLQHFKRVLYESANTSSVYGAFASWVLFMVICVSFAGLICHTISKQAVGSGIPEVKVIMHGFAMKNYLTMRTLIAKIFGLVLTLGTGFPVGKEGPFVHMGAIVASLLSRATSACTYNAFFSNEGRIMEMLSSGCAVGIACTFSAPAGGVLYGIESTSKYFALKNYWRSFFATTCSAIIFRFAMAFILPQHIAGTITAYYQTSFPNEVFFIDEIPLFALLGAICGLAAAAFIWLNRQMALLVRKNKACKALWTKSPIIYTAIWAVVVSVLTFPDGLGQFCAGKLTFREALSDFLANCTFTMHNKTAMGCPHSIIEHWTRQGAGEGTDILLTLVGFLCVYFFLISICITLYVPSGVFVPSFVVGAAMGRLMGEVVSLMWPEGIRGISNPQIFPGLYAVIGAAAYTGAVTHSLSIAVIVCETTGQLSALLPVLIALMIANALCSFIQPSIYESTILIKGYPYLADLPPSRISVHTLKVEKIMIKDIIYITKETTYKELRAILLETPQLKSYPFVTDRHSMTLLGSVSRKYLTHLLSKKLGPDPAFANKRVFTPSEILNTLRNRSSSSNLLSLGRNLSIPNTNTNPLSLRNSWSAGFLTDRSISGNTLLAHSPLHESGEQRAPLVNLLMNQNEQDVQVRTMAERVAVLASPLAVEGVAIDPAPFQLVRGTSLYKVHTLFSLLALNHAYVTDKGKLIGVVALKELRKALANIYTRGAVAPMRKRTTASVRRGETDTEEVTNLNETGQEDGILIDHRGMNGENSHDGDIVINPRRVASMPGSTSPNPQDL